MKVKHTSDIEDYLQQLVEAEESLPAAEELGLTKREYEMLRNKYDFSDEFGEFFGEPK